LLSGCASQRVEQKLLLWKQQEARLYDIPIMMHAYPDYAYQDECKDDYSTFVAYTVPDTCDGVQSYYVQNMERYGWQHAASVDGYEKILVFEKPQKLCIISLRSAFKKGDTKVVIAQSYGNSH
jgi:hypothetical protein